MPTRRRQKISTTIAPENQKFLRALIRTGKAANLAEAVDRAVSIARRAAARARVEIAYYASLAEKELERELENAVGHAATLVDYDGE
jgi:F0F1-type ATP synthase delta subunit